MGRVSRCAKWRYRDEIAAMFALASMGRHREQRASTEVRAYRCPKCRGWHLTSMPLAQDGAR